MVRPVPDIKSFKQRLEELGHTGAEKIDLEFRLLAGDEPAGRAFGRVAADVIVAEGAPALIAAMQATRGIPIVMLNVPLPVEMGFVKSIDHPGSRVTGIAPDARALFARRLAILKETFPGVRKVVALGHLTYSRPGSYMASSRAAAEGLGLSVESVDVSDVDVASVCASFVKKGQQAVIVSRILKGQVVNTLPVQTAVQTELAVNLKTAKALGIDIPPSVPAKASQIIREERSDK